MPAEAIGRLDLCPVKLELGHEIEVPGDEIRNLYFIEAGLGSMTTLFSDGAQVEVGLFGYEAVIGVSALMGTKRSLNNIYMQAAGPGFVSRIKTAALEFHRNEQFHDLALRYVQAQLMQTAQTAGCNARHELQQRLSRWLLLCADRLGYDVIGLTQDYLGHMLGVRRSTVSIAAEEMQRRGLIEYTRGRIRLLDRSGLEEVACECYRIVKNHLENYHEVETGFAA